MGKEGPVGPVGSDQRRRILSWNINGLRSTVAMFGSLDNLLRSLNADIVCFQEHKLRKGELDSQVALADGWEAFFAFTRTGAAYSGVVTFVRRELAPVHAEEGLTGILAVTGGQPVAVLGSAACAAALQRIAPLWHDHSLEALQSIDWEGRCVITDHGTLVLFNVYAPARTDSDKAEERVQYKLAFLEALGRRMRSYLQQGRHVILLGDLNAYVSAEDQAGQDEAGAAACTRGDRRWLLGLLAQQGGPFHDTFRVFHPKREGAYTCWCTASGARINNWGARIDFVLVADGRAVRQQQQQQQQQPALQHTLTALPHPGLGALADLETMHSRSRACRSNHQHHESQSEPYHDPHAFKPAADSAAAAAGSQAAADSATAQLPAAPSWLVDADIMPALCAPSGTWASDHAPVWCDLSLPAMDWPTGHPLPAMAARWQFGQGKQAKLDRLWSSRAATLPLVSNAMLSQPSSKQQAPGQQQQQQQGPGSSQLLNTHLQGAAGYSHGRHPDSLAGDVAWRSSRPGGDGSSSSSHAMQCWAEAADSQHAVQEPGQTGSHQDNKPNEALKFADFSKPGTTTQGRSSYGHSSAGAGAGAGAKCSGPRARPAAAQLSMLAFMRTSRTGTLSSVTQMAGTASGGGAAAGKGHSAARSKPLENNAAPSAYSVQPSTSQFCSASPTNAAKLVGCQAAMPQSTLPVSHQQHESQVRQCLGPSDGGPTTEGAMECIELDSQPSQLQHPPLSHPPVQAGPGATGNSIPIGMVDVSEQWPDIRTGSEDADGLAAQQPHQEQQQQQSQSQSHQQSRQQDARSGWQRIQALLAPPLCPGHSEPCVIRTTKKPGPNNGRTFWVCARPAGPQGVGRCDHFEWADKRSAPRGMGEGLRKGGAGSGSVDAAAAGRGGGGLSSSWQGPSKRPRT